MIYQLLDEGVVMLTACSELPVRFELPVGNPASSACRSVWFPLGGAAAAATSPPMQARWESDLTKAEADAPKVKARTANVPTATQQATTAANPARDRAAGADDQSTDRAPAEPPGSGPSAVGHQQHGAHP